jgi:hypothetical protein
MMGGMGAWMILWGVLGVVLVVLIVAGAVWAARELGHRTTGGPSRACSHRQSPHRSPILHRMSCTAGTRPGRSRARITCKAAPTSNEFSRDQFVPVALTGIHTW